METLSKSHKITKGLCFYWKQLFKIIERDLLLHLTTKRMSRFLMVQLFPMSMIPLQKVNINFEYKASLGYDSEDDITNNNVN